VSPGEQAVLDGPERHVAASTHSFPVTVTLAGWARLREFKEAWEDFYETELSWGELLVAVANDTSHWPPAKKAKGGKP
jgi:membrane-bound lytic murein transglycosylase MltF